MEVLNKIKDKMRDYCRYIENGGKWYSSQINIESLNLMIITELEDDNKTEYIEASIRWCYSMDTTIKEKFENSEDGFNKACEWLDDMRVEFAKRLL